MIVLWPNAPMMCDHVWSQSDSSDAKKAYVLIGIAYYALPTTLSGSSVPNTR